MPLLAKTAIPITAYTIYAAYASPGLATACRCPFLSGIKNKSQVVFSYLAALFFEVYIEDCLCTNKRANSVPNIYLLFLVIINPYLFTDIQIFKRKKGGRKP